MVSLAVKTAGPPGSHCRFPGRTGAQRKHAQSSSPPPETPEYHVRDFFKTYLLRCSSQGGFQQLINSHSASYLLKGPRNDASLLV